MRVPDRRWAEIDAYGGAASDHRGRLGDLAERLMRLAAGHPSADPGGDANPDDLDPFELELDRQAPAAVDADDTDRDGVTPDDRESPEADAAGGSQAATPTSGRSGRGADLPASDVVGGNERTPYRPWFGADDAGVPWFAQPTDSADSP